MIKTQRACESQFESDFRVSHILNTIENCQLKKYILMYNAVESDKLFMTEERKLNTNWPDMGSLPCVVVMVFGIIRFPFEI